jgi:uncharacterized protein
MSMTSSRRPGRWVLALCAALALASVVLVLTVMPEGSPVSSDPGAPVVPWWVVVLPPVVGIALCLAVPRRQTVMPAEIEDQRRFAASTTVLVVLAVAFPLLVGILDLGGSEWYVLAKLALFMVVPGVVVATVRGVRIGRRSGSWRWWAPVAVIVVWTLLSQVAPWNPRHDLSGIDPATLLISATATAITAGVGEELFYRRWLQTRLEAGFGAATGIAVASLAFALMHLGSHGSGEPLVDVARVIVAQGSFGLFVGVLWWRYRNLVAIVAAHLIANGWQVVLHLLAGGAE